MKSCQIRENQPEKAFCIRQIYTCKIMVTKIHYAILLWSHNLRNHTQWNLEYAHVLQHVIAWIRASIVSFPHKRHFNMTNKESTQSEINSTKLPHPEY